METQITTYLRRVLSLSRFFNFRSSSHRSNSSKSFNLRFVIPTTIKQIHTDK